MRRPDLTLATVDHNVPTTNRKSFKSVDTFIEEADSRLQAMTLEQNVKKFNLTYFGLGDKRQGIVHIIGPEQGFTLPGTTLVSIAHRPAVAAFHERRWVMRDGRLGEVAA